MEQIKNSCIVLYPSPGIGHLVSMVEFGKLIISNHPHSFTHIIIFITTASHLNNSAIAPYISQVSATTRSIIFHHLTTTPLPAKDEQDSNASIETLNFELQNLSKASVCQALEAISSEPLEIQAVVMDFFCTPAFEVCSSVFGIPTYYFFTSPASSLSVFLYHPVIHQTTITSYKDQNVLLHFPGLPPIHSSDMPEPLLDRNKPEYAYLLETRARMAKSAGIIINTFQSLEPRAVMAISDGFCIPEAPTPPIYCVGPLTAPNQVSSGEQCHESLIWLNSQPSKSVIFLCFGSQGVFEEKQLKEIAEGLENSGHRFLWVVRNPPTDDNKYLLGPQEPDLNVLLPQGFLERNKGRGLVVKSWVPQVAVLNHDSVGGFVTHCGWNSILEGVCAGVPMIGWPLYAEQRLNRVILVEELKLGLGLEESDGDSFVRGAELEKRVRELMNEESVRFRVGEMKLEAKIAMEAKDGSSRLALANLVAKWKE